MPFGRAGCLGASQSFGLRRQVRWLKVWRGGGCKFSATERAHKRNGGQIDAEYRLPSLVTTSDLQRNCAGGVEIPISMKRKWKKTSNQPKPPPKPLEETIAGQGLIVIEAFTRAVEKARGKTTDEPKLSACLPVWCHNIADIFAKTIFKTMIALDPKGQFDARNFGRMFGLLLRAGVFVGKEVEPMLKKDGLLDLSKAEERKIENAAGIEHLFPVASEKFKRPIRNEHQLFSQSGRHMEKWGIDLLKSHETLFLHLWNQPIEEQHKFLCGIPEGFVTFLDVEGQFTGDRGRTNLYINLLINWREIVAMQQAEPPKSRRDLQQWLIAEAKISISNDEDWFDHLCDEIGLSMKGVGRPVKPNQ